MGLSPLQGSAEPGFGFSLCWLIQAWGTSCSTPASADSIVPSQMLHQLWPNPQLWGEGPCFDTLRMQQEPNTVIPGVLRAWGDPKKPSHCLMQSQLMHGCFVLLPQGFTCSRRWGLVLCAWFGFLLHVPGGKSAACWEMRC